MPRDVPKMDGNAWGKDTTHVGGCGDAMPCTGFMGLHAMSQQGLMSVTGHNNPQV